MPKVEKAPPWKAEPLIARLQNCALMLQLHEMATDREFKAIQRRVARLAKKG